MSENGIFLSDFDIELALDVFSAISQSKTRRIQEYHSPASHDPKTLPDVIDAYGINFVGAFHENVVEQERKLHYLVRTNNDILLVYFDRDLATYVALSVGNVVNDDESMSNDIFSVACKTKSNILGQVRAAIDDRCIGSSKIVTDMDAMRDKAIRLPGPSLTVADWQANPATGTATNPQKINDGVAIPAVVFDAVDEYCEIEFDHLFYVNKFRYCGLFLHACDGTYKLQYFDCDTQAWVDWETGIPTRTSSWSDWADLDVILTNKVRIVATALDSYYTGNYTYEWELKDDASRNSVYFTQLQNDYMLPVGDYEMIARLKAEQADTVNLEVKNVNDIDDWSVIYDSDATKILCLKVFSQDGYLYAGGDDGKIYVSEDGNSFALAYDTGQAEVHSLEEHESCLYAGTGDSGKIYKYDQAAWLEEYDTGETDVFALKSFSAHLYAGTGANGKVFRLQSESWSLFTDFTEISVSSFAIYSDILYIGTGDNGKIFGMNLAVETTYTAAGSNPTGLAHDGTVIWSCDFGTDKIYKYNPDMTVNTEYAAPSTNPMGLTHDGTVIWSCDSGTDKIYKHNPDMTVNTEYTGFHRTGLTWDGSHIWSCNNIARKIYKHNPDMTINTEYNSPGLHPFGLTWDGSRIWSLDNHEEKIYKHNPDMTVDLSFPTPTNYGTGLTWDGSRIWSCENNLNKIFKHKESINLNYDASDTIIYTLESFGGNLYAGGDAGSIYKYNGTLWSIDYASGEEQIRSLHSHDKLYAGTGNNGKLFVLNDSWVLSKDLDETCIYAGAIFQNQHFIATGHSGIIYSYRDGILATAQKTLGITYGLYKLAFDIIDLDLGDTIRFQVTKDGSVAAWVNTDFICFVAK